MEARPAVPTQIGCLSVLFSRQTLHLGDRNVNAQKRPSRMVKTQCEQGSEIPAFL